MTIINCVKYFMIFIRIFNLIIYIEYNSPLYLNDNFFLQKEMLSYHYVYASISYQVKINVIENNIFSILSTRVIFLMSFGILNFPPHNRNVYTRLSFQTYLLVIHILHTSTERRWRVYYWAQSDVIRRSRENNTLTPYENKLDIYFLFFIR